MQKSACSRASLGMPPGLVKILLVMKMLFVFITASFLTAHASGFSQTVTLSGKDLSLARVFSAIKKQTEYVVFSNKELLSEAKPVSVSVKDMALPEFLDLILKDQPFTAYIDNKTIVLYRKSAVKISPQLSLQEPSPVLNISGQIVDLNNAPVAGATITESPGTAATSADENGKFTLNNVPDNALLVISCVGFTPLTLRVSGGSIAVSDKQFGAQLVSAVPGSLLIRLRPADKKLDDIIVVGYGVMKKSDFTGSASKVSLEGAQERPYASFDGALQGRMAGVHITSNTGTPGGEMTFRVRGSTSTTGDNQPLIVVDGFPLETGNSIITAGSEGTILDVRGASGLSIINPNDIESIEVLKDASATAIYGSRGANGVIMITTKRGKSGRDKIEYSARFDFGEKPKEMDLLSTKEFMDLWNEAYRNSNPNATKPYFTALDYQTMPDINWQKLVLQRSFGQTHSVSFSGGDQKMRYSLFGSYSDLDGSVRYASNFKRGTMRFNFDREVSKRFKMGLSTATEMIKNQAVGQGNSNGNVNGSIINALLTAPLNNPYDAYGDLVNLRNANGGGNPLTLVKNVKDITNTYHVNVNTNAAFQIVDGLSLNARLGIDYNRLQRNMYQPMDTRIGLANKGYAYSGEGDQLSRLSDLTMNYNNTLGKHRINSVAGFSHQDWQVRNYASVTTGFASDQLTYYAPQSANTVQTPVGKYERSALNSFLARVAYSYDERYLFTLTGRADGSSRLAPGHKWALFPSVGIGWNVHNESFMKRGKSALSTLKLHGSWGISGNQSVPIGASQYTYTYSKYSFNQTVTTGYNLRTIGNSELGWENTSQINFGVESGFYNNRLSLSVDVYRKLTTDLLFNRAIPDYTGFSFLQTNGGKIENRGLEIEMKGTLVRKSHLTWNLSANFSMNRNKVLDLGGIDDLFGPIFNASMGKNQFWTVARVGQPIGAFYGYLVDGIYQTPEEVAAGPQDPNKVQGGWKFVDIAGPNKTGKDNKITTDDMTIMGNPYPDFTYGITNDITLGQFSASVFIMGSQGNDILNMYRIQTDALTVTTNPPNTTREVYYHRWTGPGTSNKYPKPLFINNRFYQRPNNTLVEDGSFVKLKSVTVSYELPAKTIRAFQKLRVFVTGNNLFVITKYTGFDPEINSYGFNSMSQGFDLGSMPQIRSYSAGITLGF